MPKVYIVTTNDTNSYEHTFLVKATNKKDAIDKIFSFKREDGYKKNELSAITVSKAFEDADIEDVYAI